MKTKKTIFVEVMMLIIFLITFLIIITVNYNFWDKYSFEQMYKEMQITKDADIKSGPNSKFETIGTLQEGQVINVLSQCNETGYYQILYDTDGAAFIDGTDLIDVDNKTGVNNTDIFGNKYEYNDDFDKIYNCDFPENEMYTLSKFITDDGIEVQGFYYINEDFGSEKYIQALSNITSEVGIIVSGDEYAGHYNNIKMKFAVMK